MGTMNLNKPTTLLSRTINRRIIVMAMLAYAIAMANAQTRADTDSIGAAGNLPDQTRTHGQTISLARPRLAEKPFRNKILVAHRLYYDADLPGFHEDLVSASNPDVLLALHNPESKEWVLLIARPRSTPPDPLSGIDPISIPNEQGHTLSVHAEDRLMLAGMNGWNVQGRLNTDRQNMTVAGWIGQGGKHDYALYHVYPDASPGHQRSALILQGLKHSNANASAGSLLALIANKSLQQMDWSPYGFNLDLSDYSSELLSDASAHELGIVIADIDENEDFWAIQSFCHGAMTTLPVALSYSMNKLVGREYPAESDQIDHLEWNNEKLLRIKIEENSKGKASWYQAVLIPGDTCSQQVIASTNNSEKATSKLVRSVLNKFTRVEVNGIEPYDLTTSQMHFFNDAGIYFHDHGDYQTATTYFSEAARLSHNEEQIIANWTGSLISNKEHDKAIAVYDLTRSSRELTQNEQSWLHYLQYLTNDYSAAESGYLSLFEQGFVEADDLLVYMDLLSIQERYPELLKFSETYRSAFKNSAPQSRAKLSAYAAIALQKTGQPEEAADLLQQAISDYGSTSSLLEAKILILEDQERFSELRQLAQDLIERGVANAAVYYSLAEAEFQQSHYQEAYEHLTKAVAMAPGNTQYSQDLMTVAGMIGRDDLSLLDESLEQLPLFAEWDFTATPFDMPEDSDYVVDKMYKIISFSSGGHVTKTFYMDYIIYNDAGAEALNTLDFGFDPLNEKIGVNQLNVYDRAGALIASADPDTYYIQDDTSQEASFSKALYIPVPNTAPATRVQAVITIQSRHTSTEFDYEQVLLGTSRLVRNAGLWFTGDKDAIKYVSTGLDAPEIQPDGMIWKLHNVPAYRIETMAADSLYDIPRIVLVGQSRNWETVGYDYYTSIEPLTHPGAEVLALIPLIAPDSLPPFERLQKLARYVQQNVSYTAIEFGARGYTPKTADVTLNDRYGDCKDHAVLLHSLLVSAGIASRLVLVNLDNEVLPDMPSLDQFDHMIVQATIDGTSYYIDPTDKYMPLLSYPPRHLANDHGLVLGQNSKLIELPSYADNSRRIESQRLIQVQRNGAIHIMESITAHGYAAAAFRGDLHSRTSAQRRDRLQSYLHDNGRHLKLLDLRLGSMNDLDQPFKMSIEYGMPPLPVTVPDVVPDLPVIFEQQWILPAWLENRLTDFRIEYPLHFTSSILLEQWRPVSMPVPAAGDSIAMQSEFGNWNLSITPTRAGLEIQFDYMERAGVYAAEVYDDYVDFSSSAIRVIEAAARYAGNGSAVEPAAN